MDYLSWLHVSITVCVVGQSVLTYLCRHASTASYSWAWSLIPHCCLYWCHRNRLLTFNNAMIGEDNFHNPNIVIFFFCCCCFQNCDFKTSKPIYALLFIVWQTLETAIEGEELVFLYQVKNGICQSSCAANIATLAGIPNDLVMRAVEVWHWNTSYCCFNDIQMWDVPILLSPTFEGVPLLRTKIKHLETLFLGYVMFRKNIKGTFYFIKHYGSFTYECSLNIQSPYLYDVLLLYKFSNLSSVLLHFSKE